MVQPVGHLTDGAVGVVVHFGHRHRAALVVLQCLDVHQVVVLAEDVGVAFEVGNARMVAAVAVRGAHDVARRCPGSCWRGAHGVAQSLGTAGAGEAEIVFAAAIVEPRPFLVVLDVWQLDDAVLHRNHVVVQSGVVAVGVSPVHIRLSVVVGEDCGVDVVPVFALPYDGLAQRVAEGTVWRVAHQHADAVAVEWGIEVVLAVASHRLYGPGTVFAAAPREVFQ